MDPLNLYKRGYAERQAKIVALREDEADALSMLEHLQDQANFHRGLLEKARAELVAMSQTVELPSC